MSTSAWPAPPVPGGFGFPLGFAGGIGVTTIAIVLGATGNPGWSLAGLALTVAAMAALTTIAAAVGTAVVCWCLQDGFVIGRHGDLVFTSGSGTSAAVLLLTALVVAIGAVLVRTVRNSPAGPAIHVPVQRPAPEAPAETYSLDEWRTW